MMHLSRPRRSNLRPWALGHAALVALSLSAVCGLRAPAFAQAPPTADRSELEAKRKEQEERRKEIERLKAEATRETSDQKEARLRAEAKAARGQEALAKAQAALAAASRRQNRQGQQLMYEAWMLDPTNMDYPFNTAAFAEANNDTEAEFWAYAGFISLAMRELLALGPSNSDYKLQVEERVTKARTRMEVLGNKVGHGEVEVTIDQDSCEIYLDGAYLGKGKGTITALTGQRRVRAECQGFKTIDQAVNVRAGDSNKIPLVATSIEYYGFLIFNVKPNDEVTVFLDDIDLVKRRGVEANAEGSITGTGSKTDPIRLMARKWVIRFQKQGYDRWHRRIEVRRDQITIVNAALEKMSDTVESSGSQ